MSGEWASSDISHHLHEIGTAQFTLYMYIKVTALCSEGSMFRRFYVQKIFVQKVLCSEGPIYRRSYVQKVLCSEGPMFRKYLFKRSYIQKVLCSEGPIFRYIQKVLYSENSLFYVGKNLHLSVSGKLQCKITASHFSSFGQMSFCHAFVSRLSVHNLPKSLLGLQ